MDDGSTSAYSLPMGRLLRLRIIALAAAYAVALQGLLSAFTPVAVALPVGVLCSGQILDETTVPAPHERPVRPLASCSARPRRLHRQMLWPSANLPARRSNCSRH